MSIVIAVKKDDVVYLGADSQVTRGDEKFNYTNEESYKIQKLKSGLLLAWTGQSVTKQFIFSHTEWFDFDEKEGLTKEQIVKNIIPQIYKGLKESGLLEKEKNNIPNLSGTIFLAYKDKLYQICRSFTVLRYDEFQAIGSGSNYVQFGLPIIDKSKDINSQIYKLLKISASQSTTVSAPFVFINTKELKYQVKGE